MIEEGKLNPERHTRSGDAQADALEKTISRGKSVVKAGERKVRYIPVEPDSSLEREDRNGRSNVL